MGPAVMSATGQAIVRDVSLRAEPGEAIAVIGRSGAGKTTLLRLLNGLARPSTGSVTIDDIPLDGDLAVRRRQIGTILQVPALFPHRTVFDNVATVPRLLEWPEERIRAEAEGMMEQLGMPLEQFAHRFPRSLSGGEQQRVAIARSMIAAPPLLRAVDSLPGFFAGVADQGHREVEPPTHATGVGHGSLLGCVNQVELVEQLGCAASANASIEVVQVRHQDQVLLAGQEVIDRRELTGDTDCGADQVRLPA